MKYIICILLVCLSTTAFAQNAYYDALFCASLNKGDLTSDDISNRGLTQGEMNVLDTLRSFIEKPFDITRSTPDFTRARTIFRKIRAVGVAAQEDEASIGMATSSLLTPLLNLSNLSTAQLDTILYGLTVYFADEFRRDYLETYLRTFDRSIGRVGELQVLFPATYRKMRSFDPARYKDLGNELKLVFQDDLSSSLDHLIQHVGSTDDSTFANKSFLLLNKSVCEKLQAQKSFKYLTLSARVGQKLIKGVHPGDIISYLDETYYQSSVPNSQTLGASATLADLFSTTGSMPISATITPAESITALQDDFGNAIHLINILQRNLRDTTRTNAANGSNVWINFEELTKLNTPLKQLYFMALLYREDNVFFERYSRLIDPSSFTTISTNNLSVLNGSDTQKVNNKYTDLKQNVIAKLLSVLVRIDEYTHMKKDELMSEQNFIPFMKLTTDVLELALPKSGTLVQQTNKYVSLINESMLLHNAIRVRNYSNISLHLGRLIDNIVHDIRKDNMNTIFINELITNIESLTTGSTSTNYSWPNFRNTLIKRYNVDVNLYTDPQLRRAVRRVFPFFSCNFPFVGRPTSTIMSISTIASKIISKKTLIASVNDNSLLQDFMRRMDKITAFTSGVVSATTSDDIKQVITQFASPPSSYIDKRTHGFTLSITGMPGLYVGIERFIDKQVEQASKTVDANGMPTPVAPTALTLNQANSYQFTYGLSLPIGLDITWSPSRHRQDDINRKPASVGVFAYFLDLGAMLSYRISSNSNSLPDKVEFSDVLSPGFSLNVGLPNTALTIGLGYQYAPKLRGFNEASKPKDQIQTEASTQTVSVVSEQFNAHRFQLRIAYDIPLFNLVKTRR